MTLQLYVSITLQTGCPFSIVERFIVKFSAIYCINYYSNVTTFRIYSITFKYSCREENKENNDGFTVPSTPQGVRPPTYGREAFQPITPRPISLNLEKPNIGQPCSSQKKSRKEIVKTPPPMSSILAQSVEKSSKFFSWMFFFFFLVMVSHCLFLSYT